jgi:DNA repair protein RadD
MKLYDYQEKIVQETITALPPYNNVGIKLPCGGGKTIIACELIRYHLSEGKRCLFIVDRTELIEQSSDKLTKYGIDHGIIQAGNSNYNPWVSVHIASIQTLSRRNQIPDVGFVIVDEFHTMYKHNKLIVSNPDIQCVGLSATPWSVGLKDIWHHLVVGPSTQELIDRGALVAPKTYSPSLYDVSGVQINAGKFNNKQLSSAVNKKHLVADVVENWLENGEGRKTICFATDTDHARALSDQFTQNGVKSEYLSWRTDKDERKHILKSFSDGHTEMICNVDILSKGYDEPTASCLIDAAPTMSLIRHIQKNRVTRTCEGKIDALIFDHAGNSLRHCDVTDPTPDHMICGSEKYTIKPLKSVDPKERVCANPICGVIKPIHWRGRVCQICGHESAPPPPKVKIKTVEGKLTRKEKSEPTEAELKTDYESKYKWYRMFIWYGKENHYKDGWAAYRYKDRYGEWPPRSMAMNATPYKPDSKIITYLRISTAKRKRT